MPTPMPTQNRQFSMARTGGQEIQFDPKAIGERDGQQTKGDVEWERKPAPLQWTSPKIPSQICLKQWIH
ncbi:hypothetical protein TB2_045610 [Malus domestica]